MERNELLQQIGAADDLVREAGSLEKLESKPEPEQGASIHTTGFALHIPFVHLYLYSTLLVYFNFYIYQKLNRAPQFMPQVFALL